MNRPNPMNYSTIRDYMCDLDLYCDKLDNALDKACKMLYESAAVMGDEPEKYRFANDPSEWKTWALNNEGES